LSSKGQPRRTGRNERKPRLRGAPPRPLSRSITRRLRGIPLSESAFYKPSCCRPPLDAALPRLPSSGPSGPRPGSFQSGSEMRAQPASVTRVVGPMRGAAFLPHGSASDAMRLQPLWLTHREETLNGASLLLFVRRRLAGGLILVRAASTSSYVHDATWSERPLPLAASSRCPATTRSSPLLAAYTNGFGSAS